MAVTVTFEDIISKPVSDSYELIQSLGIYCWQYEKPQKNALFFLPRFSFDKNKDYLEKVYPSITEKEYELSGKGIYISIWKISHVYNKVSVKNPEKILSNDPHTLSVFKAWCSALNLNSDLEQQIYVLKEEKKFVEYKYTATQNPTGTIYYNWDDILCMHEIK